MRMMKKWLSHHWVYCSCFVSCLLFTYYVEYQHPWHENTWINTDYKNLHTKFDSMDVNTWSLTGGAACFLWWMILTSFKTYINMKESWIKRDKMIDILSDACWCLFNDFYWWQKWWHNYCHMMQPLNLMFIPCNFTSV